MRWVTDDSLLEKKKDCLHLNGGAIFEGTSLYIKTFTTDSIRMERDADFRRGRITQRQGREYHSNLERIGKTHCREWTYNWCWDGSGKATMVLSLSSAMLLESLTCHSLMRCDKSRMLQRTGAAVPLHLHDLWLFPSKIKSEHSKHSPEYN